MHDGSAAALLLVRVANVGGDAWTDESRFVLRSRLFHEAWMMDRRRSLEGKDE